MDENLKKAKSFTFYLVIGIIVFLFGILILPFWDSLGAHLFFAGWSEALVDIMTSGLLALYIGFYLVKRIKRYSGTPAQIVAIVELVLMVVIAVICAVSFLGVVSLGSPCQIFGLAIWVRGAAGAFTGYYNNYQFKKGNKKEDKKEEKKSSQGGVKGVVKSGEFTVWHLALAVLFISAGAYLFIAPPFREIHLQWMFSFIVIGTGVVFTVYSFVVKSRAKTIAKNAEADCGAVASADNPYAGKIKSNDTKKLSKKEKQLALEEGRVNIKLTETKEVNAMTDTNAYDKVNSSLVPTEKDK